jgi:hypothetical protein
MKKSDLDEKHQFHDACIDNIFVKKADLLLDIIIDTYWFPGKKHGWLLLKRANFDKKITRHILDLDFDYLKRMSHKMLGKKHIFEITFQSNQRKVWRIVASSYRFERQNSSFFDKKKEWRIPGERTEKPKTKNM